MPETHRPMPAAVENQPRSLQAPRTFPIVAIGASVGGLQACKRFLSAVTPDSGMAYVFVQHLEPTHGSLLVELLADHAPIPLLEAIDGMQVEPNTFYIISPGSNLAIDGGVIRLTQLEKQPGLRNSFNFLLRSLAMDCGRRAVCVVLTGTGSDGSDGLMAVKSSGGLVIAQDPGEAAADGMPRNAIATGKVDMVLPSVQCPRQLQSTLVQHTQRSPGLRVPYSSHSTRSFQCCGRKQVMTWRSTSMARSCGA